MKLKKSKIILLVLILIFILTLFLRLYGLGFGLNDGLYIPSDENTIISKANNIVDTGDLNPHFFEYPSLYIYLQAVLIFLTKRIVHSFDVNYYLIGRMLTVLFGGTTVWLVYLICKKIYNKEIGLYSCLFIGTAFAHVHMSHYITTDIPMAFLCMLSFYFALDVLLKGRIKDYVYTGLFAGLTFAAKYNFVVLILPFVAHLLYCRDKEIPFFKYINIKLFLCVLFIFLGFFLGCPYSILDFREFLKDMIEMINQLRFGTYFTGANDANLVPTWKWYVRYFWSIGLWYPMFIMTAGGIAYLFFHLNKKNILILLFPLLYLLQIISGSCRFDRYVIPLIPFFSIFAGLFVWFIVKSMKRWCRNRYKFYRYFFITAGIGVLFVLPMIRCSAMDYYFTKKDTRILATNWITEHIPKSAKLLDIYRSVNLNLLRNKGYNVITAGEVNFTLEQYIHKGFNYITISSEAFRIYDVYSNDRVFQRYNRNYQEILEFAKLVKEIKYPGFNWWFSNSFRLEHSSTLTVYHNPTIQIFKLPIENSFTGEGFKVEYRAEDLIRWSSGVIVEDEESMDGKAVYNGGVNGPYETYYKGDYIARYRVKIDNNSREDELFGIAVTTAGRGRVLASKGIRGIDFIRPNEYQDFILSFSLERNNSLEFLVHYDKRCNLWVESIEIEEGKEASSN